MALLAADALVLVIALWLAYALRFDFAVPQEQWERFLRQVPLVIGIQLVAVFLCRIPMFVWRYISLREVTAFASAAAFAIVPVLVLRIALPETLQTWRVPLSVILVDSLLAFGGLLGVRVVRRLVYERLQRRGTRRGAGCRLRRVVLVGAGRGGVLAAREIRTRTQVPLEVVGFVDDDPLKQGMVINGCRVMGMLRDLPRLAGELGIEEAIITIAEPSTEQLRRFSAIFQAAGLNARAMPGFYELLTGNVRIDRFRHVSPEELLGRDPVNLDASQVAETLAGRRVMVTGAGGSIGSELVRQVARLVPTQLILIERAEFALFAIDQELRSRWPDLTVTSIVADVGDQKRMRGVFAAAQPEVVIHAAAHKHVPLMEDNACEAVRNNVLATHALATLSGQFGAERFVLISTDKAVRPTSIMGATKRMAELVIQDVNRRFETAYVAVRFGNVLGSVGSVIPIFEAQIRNGGPVTVTHPEMKRYFMTIPEAAQLVLEAGTMGVGGEIFVLDMGEPVRIIDLAERLIRLHGFEPHKDIPIKYTGVRPGEKLCEELGFAAEELANTRHPKILIGKIAAVPGEEIERALRTMEAFSHGAEPDTIREFMNDFLASASLAVGGEERAELARKA